MLHPLRGEKFQRVEHFFRKHPRSQGDVRLFRHRNRKQKGTNKHHMTNRSRGGKSTADNILIIDKQRHAKLHKLFGNMSWEEIHDTLKSIFGVGEPKRVISVMERISRLKGRVA